MVTDQVQARVYPTLDMLEAFNTATCSQCYSGDEEWYGIGGLCCFGHLFFQWLGVTRASDLLVSCGHNAFVPFNIIDTYTKKDGQLRCTKTSPNVILSGRYRVTRAGMRWYDMVVNTRYCSLNWGYPPTVALMGERYTLVWLKFGGSGNWEYPSTVALVRERYTLSWFRSGGENWGYPPTVRRLDEVRVLRDESCRVHSLVHARIGEGSTEEHSRYTNGERELYRLPSPRGGS